MEKAAYASFGTGAEQILYGTDIDGLVLFRPCGARKGCSMDDDRLGIERPQIAIGRLEAAGNDLDVIGLTKGRWQTLAELCFIAREEPDRSELFWVERVQQARTAEAARASNEQGLRRG